MSDRCHRQPALVPIGLAVAVSLGLFATGCGSGGPTMGKVSGNVTFDGKPLEKGTITFFSTDGQRPNASGTIQAGSYTLQTTEPGDGAVVGDYNVAVTDIDSNTLNTELPGAPVTAPKSAIPEKYTNPASSGLTAKVEKGSNTKNFDLTSK